ncbi:MAG: prepilin-type N-terminal cleavage/methylation domain-containing protein [Gammaproteobacteria bacterium]|nr:prepilin-type N-terminal cleavage/methylation domain-containing protein [Gammaproteobacteria bacterium]
MIAARRQGGMTMPELLITLVMAGLLMSGLAGVVSQGLQAQQQASDANTLAQQAAFAMQRMTDSVLGSRRLLLPLADNPATNWREHVREQTLPASVPEGSSTFASAVLAVTLPPSIDRDRDGWADANNDRDFLDRNNNGIRDPGEPERIDEDPGADASNDGKNGIIGIDDNGNGTIDDGAAPNAGVWVDDDEDGQQTEDVNNGEDDDGDGSVDEDSKGDISHDGSPGVAGVDDDLDGTVDEGNLNDDDEDGSHNEDWPDPVVYYLSGSKLIERLPSLADQDGDGVLTGKDFTEHVIAEHVSRFRVERVPVAAGQTVLVDLLLELTSPVNGEVVSVQTRVRVAGH